MARHRVADGGTASNMEGSCEYMNPLALELFLVFAHPVFKM
jgi:hypothetical protein